MLHLLTVTLARKKNPPFVPFLFLPLVFLKEKKVSSFRAFVLRLSAACCPPYTILQIKKPSCFVQTPVRFRTALLPGGLLMLHLLTVTLARKKNPPFVPFLFLPLVFLKEKKVSSFRAFVLRLSAACCPPYTILQIKKPSCFVQTPVRFRTAPLPGGPLMLHLLAVTLARKKNLSFLTTSQSF